MKLFAVSVSDFDDLQGAELISPDRQKKMDRYHLLPDKQRCLSAGLLLRHALGEDEKNIVFGSHGKPFLPGGPCFNLSHSGDHAVLAVSDKAELGIDLEKIGAYKDKLARRCCTTEEYEHIRTGEAEAFYKLWTGKESVMKALGLGFALPAASFSLLPLEDGLHYVEDSSLYLRWLDILPGYALCAASKAEEDIDIVFLSADTLLE